MTTLNPSAPLSPIPRKLNQGMIDALSEAIRKGNYAITACQLCNLPENTFYEWLRLAQTDYDNGWTEEDSLYVSLAQSLKRAEAEAEARLVEVVRESAEVKREWLPAMTFLERRHPDRWGRRERHDINVNEVKRIQVTRINIRETREEAIEGQSRELLEEGEEG